MSTFRKTTSKRVLPILLSLAIILTTFVSFGIINSNAAVNGPVKAVGSQICDQSGNPIQLRGMSSHGVCWYGSYINESAIKWLRDDWKINAFRIAMYTEATAGVGSIGGYINNPSGNMTIVKRGIDACINLGLYVIVDWHILSDNDPNKYVTQAKDFFNQIATQYGSSPNIIYEICNEPNGVDWNTIKNYANQVIPVIRAADPDSFIIVGTPTWSQDVDVAANSPLSFSNIAYACHFYSGTHGQYLRDKINACTSKGYPVVISEWGNSQASGTGGVYPAESDTWLSFLDSKNISHFNWSLCDKNETSAALNPGASTSGNWSTSNLSASGQYVRGKLIAAAGTSTPTATPSTATQTPTATPSTATQTPTATPSTSTPTATPVTSTPTATPVTSTPTATPGTSTPTATPSTSTPTPTPVATSGGIKVQFFNGNTSATTNSIYTNFRVVNTGTSAVTLSNVKMRYYFTNDGTQANSFACDYANVGSGNITSTFATIAKTNADRYLEVGFTSGAGTLGAGAGTEVKGRLWKSDWSNFTQTNDYSFNAQATNYVDAASATGYISGALAWGTEP